MDKTIFMLGSITHAFKGRDYLQAKGYKVYVDRPSKELDPTGCGYVLTVHGDFNTVKSLLDEVCVRIIKIQRSDVT